MRTTIRVFVAGLCCAAAALLAQQSSGANKLLTADELAKLVDHPGKTFFLDVREPRELVETGAVPGYVNIPKNSVESRLSEIPKDRPIVSICARGGRAGLVATLLESKGYHVIGLGAMLDFRDKYKDKLVYPKPEAQKSGDKQ